MRAGVLCVLSLSPLSHILQTRTRYFWFFISHSLFLHLCAHQLVANEQTNPAIVSLWTRIAVFGVCAAEPFKRIVLLWTRPSWTQ